MMFNRAVASLLLALVPLLTSTARAVENTWDYSVRVSATVSASPAQVTLSWPQDTNGVPSSYTIFRKAPTSTSWGSGTTLAGSSTSWTDTNVTTGTTYEYRIVKAASGYTGYGYIQTGINAPLVDTRGRVVLVVDNRFSTSLATELSRLEQDLAGDGWTVVRHDVSRTDSPTNIKNLIRTSYNADPANTKAVFLFGNIPVPYSGQLNPDGHPDHIGAWPADVYYGDIDGNWTDSTVNYTQTMNTDPVDAARMTNKPGDGKFDQTTIPSSVELAVGRVDLSKLPGRVTWGGPATFQSETELLRAYLNKDHNFRHRATNPVRRGIVGDYFGIRGGEAFAASGYRSFAPLVGPENVRNLNTEYNDQKGIWMTQTSSQEYLFAYGCGAGSYSSISGLGNDGNYNAGTTPELVRNNAGGVFNLLMGSWLGDWDHEDSILRAPLATNRGLVSVWSGRPHWYFHPMGLGATVGDVTRLTQNNTGLYENQQNSSAARIHIALMGDPTLRLHPVVPARNLTGSATGSSVALSWTASTDSNIVGYHVYRASSAKGPFTRLTNSPITSVNHTDTSAMSGAIYMVRAVKLENTTSGSYYNASQGTFWSQTGGSTGTTTTASPTTDTSTTTSSTTTTIATTTADTSSTSSSTTLAGTTLWFDDALPAGATGSGTGGENWNWVTSNPTPVSGTRAHQSIVAAGLHGVSFNWAAPLTVNAGEVLVTYVYLDPANMPTEIMLAWAAGGNWEHRAYWGADKINYGTNGTAGRRHMGALPAGGQWIRLEVPASAVALEGQQVVGMSLLTFDGRATFDAVGKAASSSSTSTTTTPATTTSTPTTSTTTTPTITTKPESVWFDDALPSGAVGSSTNGDTWNWIASNPAPVSGTRAHQGNLAAGEHSHSFNWAAPFTVNAGDIIFTWVYLDPANAPTEIMLAFNAGGNWEHRAYWGADRINYGTNGTAGRRHMGALPPAGQWVRLEIPASALALEDQQVTGMSFLAFDGRVTWDKTGLNGSATTDSSTSGGTTTTDTTTTAPTTPPPTTTPADTTAPMIAISAPAQGATVSGASVIVTASATDNVGVAGVQFKIDGANLGAEITTAPFSTTLNTTTLTNGTHTLSAVARDAAGNVANATAVAISINNTTTTPPPSTPIAPTAATNTIWFDDALPPGAVGSGTNGETWRWVTSNPAPFSGTHSHQSTSANGEHSHSFNWATPMSVNTGDILVTYVYLDAGNNTPKEIMLAWCENGSWEHRAFWGQDRIRYGTKNSASRFDMGALPAAGRWVRLEVPAKSVGLEGKQVIGMSFITLDGRATYDAVGKATPGSSTGGTDTTTPPSDSPTTTPIPNSLAENVAIRTPAVGDNFLTILTPTTLELRRITTKQPDPAMPTEWNFVSSSGAFTAPSTSEFAVTINNAPVTVKSIGFRRRVAYAPDGARDLRIDNALILELNGTVAEGATVEVKNASGALWPSTMQFKSVADALRYNPAIHVNQEGYVPSLPKKAMVGYYLGSLGEMDINASVGFKIVNAATGATVHSGTFTHRRETGFQYTPLPYQKVYEADFSSVTTPGEYQLVVPGLGASLPFVINDGVAMAFTRTYALGLYHQRCGTDCKLPFTRHTHGNCHMLPAEIPSPQSSYAWTWSTIASKNTDAKSNPRHTAPRLDSEAAQLYPFVNKGTVDVTGGHHDAGDYSKYTINVAQLVHQLTFTADSIAGAGALDNLGLPESGDGVSDILQEAKHEADYLAKLQDADGGFYFIVYPKTRAYENNVTPDKGDQQVVWPKNTSATAASVAALAQIASSPQFRQKYPAEAAAYLAKAKLGWQFLTSAIAKHGKDGSYQMVTFYGNNYMHDDELAWAAAELFLATGDTQYHQKLMEWFPNPGDSSTFRWGWWRMSESWGNALRSYAFGARSGRVAASALNATYLSAAEQQIKLAADDVLKWTKQSAYGTSFPEASKHVLGAGWFFSLDGASDIAVAQQLTPNPEYIDALVANMNFEAGTNPVNVSYITGLGLKRQREIVHQWTKNDHRTLPMPGIPVGNVTAAYSFLATYGASGNELSKLSYPNDGTSGTFYPFYDRWADTWNVTAEFITVNQSRAIMSVAVLAAQTASRTTAWKPSTTVKIVAPTSVVPVGEPLKLTLDTAGLNLAGARVTWEARDQEPDYGSTYTITPKNAGPQWVEVEIMWADGRRMFGTGSFEANAAVINWVDDAIPAGATTSAEGGDGWNWVSSSPTPTSGKLAHQTPAGTGLRSHTFNYATTSLPVAAGDTLFAWVYLEAGALPEEIMLCWTDGSWEHRAYWGADRIGWGASGTAGRRRMGDVPAGGGWVKLEVPASAVALEGRNVVGMTFATYGGGKVTWDAAGRSSPVK